MGKFVEYLKLLPKGLANLDKVVEGIQNQIKMELGVISELDLEIITGRRLICSQCPFMSVNAQRLGIYHSAREDEHCIHCGCPIATRTASLESNCGIEDFNNAHPEEPLTLKWIAIKKD